VSGEAPDQAGLGLGYARVMTEGGQSLDDQERVIRERAETAGLRLERIYQEVEPIEEREIGPALREALAALEPGATLIIAGMASLSNDLLTQELVLRDIRERGAAVVSCRQDEEEYLADDAASLARDLELP
jgi:DNA invertase Pin-like site-specific DNA recombinase